MTNFSNCFDKTCFFDFFFDFEVSATLGAEEPPLHDPICFPNFPLISCSQMKFVAVRLVLSFSSDHLDFCPQKWDEQIMPGGQ